MHEHGDEYMDGKGNWPERYVYRYQPSNGMLPIDINAHGTILGSEGYLIGGRMSVDETMLPFDHY